MAISNDERFGKVLDLLKAGRGPARSQKEATRSLSDFRRKSFVFNNSDFLA